MRLSIMRHGPAEDRSASGRDDDRALTEKGRARVRDVVRVLVREGELPGRIITSRLVRAAETADIVAAANKAAGWAGETETARELMPAGKLLELVQRLSGQGADDALIIGHEPDLSTLVERLLGDPMAMPMDKAMVVSVQIHPGGAATSRFILDPVGLVLVDDHRS